MSSKDQTVNHQDQMVMLARLEGRDLPERLWTYDDYAAVSDQPADLAAGLVSLAFIKAAIRRSMRFLLAMTAAGILIGSGLYVAFPPAYQASTSVLLTFGPYENVTTAAADDQVIAQSHTVASLALHKLGLRQSVSSFAAAYTVSAASNRVLLITANAPSTAQAVRWANAVAAAFLRFRSGELEAEQALVLTSFGQQVSEARQQLDSIRKQISQLPAHGASPAQQAQLSKLQTERTQLASNLYTLQQSAAGSPVKAATALAVRGSRILDTGAAIPHSRLKRLLLYPAAGLILGLALGLGIVAVRALISDRLRRRDEIAQALGAPVKLTVGPLRRNQWLPGQRTRAATDADIRRVADYLHSIVPARSQGPAALAVIPIDNPQVAVLSLTSLAVSYAQEGRQVVVADLCPGSGLAQLLGTTEPGIHSVPVRSANLVVAVPERDDVVPCGPLGHPPAGRQRSSFAAAVASACSSADFLLTLTTLDPAVGGEHLPTWAAEAVAVVTAGKSSATRIHAVGEMARGTGVHLISAVLVGGDKNDDSLGQFVAGEDFPAPVNWGRHE